jgi:hypothetical protein
VCTSYATEAGANSNCIAKAKAFCSYLALMFGNSYIWARQTGYKLVESGISDFQE